MRFIVQLTDAGMEADASVIDRHEHGPDRSTGFTAALGLMSRIDIVDGKWTAMGRASSGGGARCA